MHCHVSVFCTDMKLVVNVQIFVSSTYCELLKIGEREKNNKKNDLVFLMCEYRILTVHSKK